METLCGGFDHDMVTPHVLTLQQRADFVTGIQAPTALIVREWMGANAWRLVLQEQAIRAPQDIGV